MRKKQVSINETLLYTIIFSLAIGMRLLLLGAFPLREVESEWAYQAWELWKGQGSGSGYETGYLSLTHAFFALFGSTNLLARLWPAFVGSFVVWVAYFFREELGAFPALIAAVGFAVDPGLVITSRSVGSPVPAMAFLLLTAGWISAGNAFWAGVCGAFFLLSGSGWGAGLILLGVTLFLSHILGICDLKKTAREIGLWSKEGQPSFSWKQTLVAGVGVLLFIGSSFFRHMEGVSAWIGAIPAYFQGWTEPSGVPVGRLLVTLIVYHPLPILFGVLGIIQGLRKRNPLTHLLSLWFIVSLFAVLVYPGRQTWDLIWALVPLWGLAGIALGRVFRPQKRTSVVWILALIIIILMSLMWLSFLGLAIRGGFQGGALLPWVMIAAAMVLALLSVSLVAAEWSWEEGKQGLVIGLSTALGLYLFSGTVSGAYLHADDPRSLWLPDPGNGQLPLIMDTVREVSAYHTGREDSIEILVEGDFPALKWALRDFPHVRYVNFVDLNDRPPVLLTGQEVNTSSLSRDYLGQDFVIRTNPGWPGVLPGDWMKWVAFRDGELEKEHILLWVRKDIYPGGDS